MTGQVHKQNRGSVYPDGDGYGPYLMGGGVMAKVGTVTYTDTADKVLFTLPEGAIPVLWLIDKTTAFNSSGTDQLNIGDGTTFNQFLSALDVSAAGQVLAGFVVGKLGVPLAADTDITARYVQSVADASAGAATIICFWQLK